MPLDNQSSHPINPPTVEGADGANQAGNSILRPAPSALPSQRATHREARQAYTHSKALAALGYPVRPQTTREWRAF